MQIIRTQERGVRLPFKGIVAEVKRAEATQGKEEVTGMISDPDDLPVLALAKSKQMGIWSNDPHLSEQNIIKVFTTHDLLLFLGYS